ncbi:MAG: PHP domain-containing protein [Bacillota bacterium]
MSAEYVDLHTHSTASDGTCSPRELAQLAKSSHLVGFALTDHDTVAGVREAADEARTLGLEFIPGIEISAAYPRPGTMHLLGYCVDPDSAALAQLSQWQIESRNQRNLKLIARLRELGVAITLEEVQEAAGGDVIGRPHIAEVLVRKGYVSSAHQAFEKYVAPGGLAYVDRERLAPRRAIELIRDSGGIPVLAHPVQLRTENDAQLQRVVKDLVDLGLAGLEVIHSDHNRELVEKYTKLADRYGLVKTGGSDFHGAKKAGIELGIAGGQRVPRAFLDNLLAHSRR